MKFNVVKITVNVFFMDSLQVSKPNISEVK